MTSRWKLRYVYNVSRSRESQQQPVDDSWHNQKSSPMSVNCIAHARSPAPATLTRIRWWIHWKKVVSRQRAAAARCLSLSLFSLRHVLRTSTVNRDRETKQISISIGMKLKVFFAHARVNEFFEFFCVSLLARFCYQFDRKLNINVVYVVVSLS